MTDRSSVEEFLDSCRESSAVAYERFKSLLAQLEGIETRAEARRFLFRLEAAVGDRFEDTLKTHYFGFQHLPIGGEGQGEALLVLLQFPSVFLPEQWSKTFFEGLARIPDGEFEGRTLAELGSGSGWITLALARRTSLAKIYGLDINPKAILCARINLYLNALDPEGAPLPDGDGKTLLDRVEFLVSDLLGEIRVRNLKVDRIIGCIPQVLGPDLETIASAIPDTASDELLYSLSNYTSRQGYLEDQFGLGLIVRALEESVEVLRPNGRIIFNLGGRPGRSILLHLVRRRGFAVREIWTTKIHQAADTDISSLAKIEESSSHRFEFFLTPQSDEPVSARTAQAYQNAGGPIYHSLTVFEGRLRFPQAVQRLYRILSRPDYRELRGALDLDFDEDPIAGEKSTFLARLAEQLPEQQSFLYGETPGSLDLRRHFAEFLRCYFAIPLSEDCLVVAPNRATALRNLLSLYAPTLALVHPLLQPGLPAVPFGKVLECPPRVDLTCKLIEALRPLLVVTTLADFEVRTPDSFLRLVETAGRTGARLVVDISPFFELESTPKANGVLQALAEAQLPVHVTLLCGLVRNRVYLDLEVCFVIAENRDLLTALTNAAEVTYSRVPLLTQDYYDTILAELLRFRLDSHEPEERASVRQPRSEEGAGVAVRVPLAGRCERAFDHPALVTGLRELPKDTVQLEYGENTLPSPALVKTSVFEAFARRVVTPSELDVIPELASFLRRRFELGAGPADLPRSRFAFGLGVAPLFSALAESCAAEDGTFVFPSGAYGYFVAAVEYFGGNWERVETRREDGFKVKPEELDRKLAAVPRPWLYLNGPVVNPTGSLYSGSEIAELLAIAARHRARVVLDVLFSGLEFEEPAEPWELDRVLADHPLDLTVLGGISKELAAGGLRFGFSYSTSEEMAEILTCGLTATPHSTMLDAARQCYRGLNHPTSELRRELEIQRQTLRRNADTLCAALVECGWEPLPPKGGLFLVARPADYLGRRFSFEEEEKPLDGENVSKALRSATHLLINNSEWTGLPGHCRFVYSVAEGNLAEGIRRLRTFRDLALGTNATDFPGALESRAHQ